MSSIQQIKRHMYILGTAWSNYWGYPWLHNTQLCIVGILARCSHFRIRGVPSRVKASPAHIWKLERQHTSVLNTHVLIVQINIYMFHRSNPALQYPVTGSPARTLQEQELLKYEYSTGCREDHSTCIHFVNCLATIQELLPVHSSVLKPANKSI